jgi:hypothetical protein
LTSERIRGQWRSPRRGGILKVVAEPPVGRTAMNRLLTRRLTGARCELVVGLSSAAPLLLACTAMVLIVLPDLLPARAFVLGAALATGWGVVGAVAWQALRRR